MKKLCIISFFLSRTIFGRCNLWMIPKKTRYGATSSDWKMHFCALPDVIFNSQVGGPNYFSKFQPWYNFMCKFIMSTSVEGDDASLIISIFELHNLNWALNSQFFLKKLVQWQPRPNCKTQPFWVYGFWLVPNGPRLKKNI